MLHFIYRIVRYCTSYSVRRTVRTALVVPIMQLVVIMIIAICNWFTIPRVFSVPDPILIY